MWIETEMQLPHRVTTSSSERYAQGELMGRSELPEGKDEKGSTRVDRVVRKLRKERCHM